MSRGPVALAMPKSMIFGWAFPSTSETRMFEGFRSRWMMAFWCACWTPSHTSMNSLSRSSVGRRVVVAVCVERNPSHVLHDEVGPALGCASPVEDLGDGGMVHEGECLALRLEAGDHLLGVHACLDDLQRHPASDRFELLGQPHLAHPAFADDLEKPVRPDASGRVSVTVRGDGVLESNGILETRCRPV